MLFAVLLLLKLLMLLMLVLLFELPGDVGEDTLSEEIDFVIAA